MTRKEEIEKEAIKQCTFKVKGINDYIDTIDNTQYKCFIAGAQWADDTMIERSVGWLKANILKYAFKNIYNRVRISSRLYESFKQAMEE